MNETKKQKYEVLAMDTVDNEEVRARDMEVLKDVAYRMTGDDMPVLVMRKDEHGNIELMYFYKNGERNNNG